MEKRAILAVTLSLLVLMGYQYFFVSEPPQVAGIQLSAEKKVKAEDAAPVTAQPAAGVAPVATAQSDAPGRDIFVETDTIKAVINTKGAAIKSWTLKAYKDKVKSGSALELVPAGREQLRFSDEESKGSESLAYTSDMETLKGNGTVTFATVRPDGIRVVKSFTFPKEGYKAQVKTTYENATSSAIMLKPVVSLSLKSKAEERAELYHELAYLSGKEVKRVAADKIKEEKVGSGKMEWIFLGNKYFITAVLPKHGSDTELFSNKTGEDMFDARIASQSLQIKQGESKSEEYEIYFGPKDVDILKAAGSKMERAIDLGFSDLVAYPLLLLFKWMYKVIPNYGFVVILLTVIIKLVFWPLSQKSYKSMKDMQKIAPLMEQLREKYKDDKEKLNREVIELYKRQKVNPLGGCLPMILQMPVFFALYAVLGGAVELRHAPFILWITDLSVKDPYYVTPLLMGATMFIQQKMTPSSGGDPAQQKVMMFMPVIFTFMFLNFSSGLVLYWLVNNVLSIGQQYYVNKYIK